MNLFWNELNSESLFVDLPSVVGGWVGCRVVGLVGLLVVTFPPGRKYQ